MRIYGPPDELYHFGIKGMKWGVRRYQNKDGSLTAAGRARQRKQLSGDGSATLGAGAKLMRVSSKNTSDAKAGGKLYVNVDEKEHQVYRQTIGTRNVLESGKAYVQEYIANNDIVVPSIKTQTKIEKSLVKNAEVQREMVDSLMKKGMSREQASDIVKPINKGMEWVKVSPLLLMTPIIPTAPLIAIDVANAKSERQLSVIRNSIGDMENKTLNKNFETELTNKGYNAYRDTNDRRVLNTRQSIVVINPDKNTRLKSSREMTKEDFGKAYAETKKFRNRNVTKNVLESDLIKDGEKEYEKTREKYIINKYTKQQREKILKKYKE